MHHVVLGTFWASAVLPFVTGHGVEVRFCQTPQGTARFFVEHWHGDLYSPVDAGTMTIQFEDQVAGTTANQTEYPDGIINNKDIYNSTNANGWGCINDATPTLVGSTCQSGQADWVYFDYQSACGRPVQYTLLAGNTCVLNDGCSGNLYPAASGWFSASDSTPPIPQVNGNALPYTITVTADNFGDTSANVSFTPSAVDDCDVNPNVTVSHPSGSSFPLGSTVVTVTTTDEFGRSATGNLTVTVMASPSSSPSVSPSASPSSSPSVSPSASPSSSPSVSPSASPSSAPTTTSSPTPGPTSSKSSKYAKQAKSLKLAKPL